MTSPWQLEHGRLDRRAIRTAAVDPLQMGFPCIRRIIEVTRESIQKKASQSEGAQSTRGKRLFITDSPDGNIQELFTDIRLRWNVENKNHHPRDATFLEDKCRCRTGNTTANLALLRGAVLTLWRRTMPDAPAPAFTDKAQRKLDVFLRIITKNQRLTRLE